ncbi:MAG: hypothetical protein HYW77_01935 [Parcubacteria group bacterium]|nr:hypothetical protein [Parcubacteria group bacterium]
MAKILLPELEICLHCGVNKQEYSRMLEKQFQEAKKEQLKYVLQGERRLSAFVDAALGLILSGLVLAVGFNSNSNQIFSNPELMKISLIVMIIFSCGLGFLGYYSPFCTKERTRLWESFVKLDIEKRRILQNNPGC